MCQFLLPLTPFGLQPSFQTRGDCFFGGFVLAVALGIIWSGIEEPDTKILTGGLDEISDELCIIVGHNGIWHAEPRHNVLPNKLLDAGCCDGHEGFGFNLFGEVVSVGN